MQKHSRKKSNWRKSSQGDNKILSQQKSPKQQSGKKGGMVFGDTSAR